MEFFRSLGECWWLSRHCTPQWEAWAVATAAAAVFTTACLGVATYRLGVAANRASSVALELAKRGRELQDSDRQREGQFILQTLRAEFSGAASKIERFARLLTDRDSDTADLQVNQREALARMIPALQLPETSALLTRLYLLEGVTASTLARALGDAKSMYRAFERFQNPLECEQGLPLDLEKIKPKLLEIVEDLRMLAAAGSNARPVGSIGVE